jgi:hypothetical protein
MGASEDVSHELDAQICDGQATDRNDTTTRPTKMRKTTSGDGRGRRRGGRRGKGADREASVLHPLQPTLP